MNPRYLRIPASVIRFLIWKLLYGRKCIMPSLVNIFIGRGCELVMADKDSSFHAKGRLIMRRDVCINIDNGSLVMGENVFFNRGCSINCRNSITIGNHCMFGENVMIYDHDHQYRGEGEFRDQGYSDGSVVIEDNVWVGSGAIILRGTKIGKNSVIGAGSLVKNDIPPGVVFYNNRQQVIKPINPEK